MPWLLCSRRRGARGNRVADRWVNPVPSQPVFPPGWADISGGSEQVLHPQTDAGGARGGRGVTTPLGGFASPPSSVVSAGAGWGIAFSSALGKSNSFFPSSPERGKFLAKCFIHACEEGELILFASSRCYWEQQWGCGHRVLVVGFLSSK